MEKLKRILRKLVIFTDRLVNLYLYYIVGACILALVPNINPNYPLFHYIFKFAGFYLIPPVFGFSFSPMALMIVLVLVSLGLRKLYHHFFYMEPQVYVMSAEEFFDKVNKQDKEFFDNLGKEPEENDENSNKENNQ